MDQKLWAEKFSCCSQSVIGEGHNVLQSCWWLHHLWPLQAERATGACLRRLQGKHNPAQEIAVLCNLSRWLQQQRGQQQQLKFLPSHFSSSYDELWFQRSFTARSCYAFGCWDWWQNRARPSCTDIYIYTYHTSYEFILEYIRYHWKYVVSFAWTLCNLLKIDCDESGMSCQFVSGIRI